MKIHNGIEYGIMAAYAEGLGVLKAANVGKRTREVDYQDKLLSAMRFGFGSHVKKAEKTP